MKKVFLQELSVDEFADNIADLVLMKLGASYKKTANPDLYLTSKETAKMLHMSLTTLSKYCKSGLIPSYRIGRNIRFKKSEIDDLINKGLRFKYRREGGVI